jgi:hypothetical protein
VAHVDLTIQLVPLETQASQVAAVFEVTPLAIALLAGVEIMAEAQAELDVKIESVHCLTLQVPAVPAAAVAAGATQKQAPSVPRTQPNWTV